jgi:hypothetical protein
MTFLPHPALSFIEALRTKERVLKGGRFYKSEAKVLSLGEDLGEA